MNVCCKEKKKIWKEVSDRGAQEMNQEIQCVCMIERVWGASLIIFVGGERFCCCLCNLFTFIY